MKDRLPVTGQPAGPAPASMSPGEQLRDDLLSALMNLGYQRQPAEKALGKVLDASPGASFEDALKATLRHLMKN
jgi:Holliday junction resolvasome RuvABC DNA-binding subunit